MNGLMTYLPLSNRHQSKQVDIASAVSAHAYVTKAIETLKALRSAAVDGFRKAFLMLSPIGNKHGYRGHTFVNCGSPNSQYHCRQ